MRLSVKPFVFGEKLHSLCQAGAVAGRTIFGAQAVGFLLSFRHAVYNLVVWWRTGKALEAS